MSRKPARIWQQRIRDLIESIGETLKHRMVTAQPSTEFTDASGKVGEVVCD